MSAIVRACHTQLEGRLTQIYHYSYMVWNIVFSNIDNKVASVCKRSGRVVVVIS